MHIYQARAISIHNAESWVNCISRTMKGPCETNPVYGQIHFGWASLLCQKHVFCFFLINAGLCSSNIYSVPACLYARVNNHPLNLYGAPTLWTAAPRKLPGAMSKCLRHSLTTRKLETLRGYKLNTGVVKL